MSDPQTQQRHSTGSSGSGSSSDLAPVDASWASAYLDSISDGVIVIDTASGYILDCNRAALDLLGRDADTMRSLHFSELLPSTTANTKTAFSRRFPDAGQVIEAHPFRRADGTEVPCDLVASVFTHRDRSLGVLNIRDVSEREAARQHAIDSERRKMLDTSEYEIARLNEQFVGHVSHELRTPLAVILSSSSMLERYYARLNETRRGEHFSRIQTQVKYLVKYLDDLRLLSRITAGQLAARAEETSMRDLVQETIEEYVTQSGPPRFDVMIDSAAEQVKIDGSLLRRVLSQLIDNAVKYGPPGGLIHIEVLRPSDGMLEARVTDHGQGLPADYLPYQFEQFRRGSNVGDVQGGGMGLNIAYRCATLAGGTLEYKMDPARGATFTVILPVG